MNRPKSLTETLVASANEFEKNSLDPSSVDDLILCVESLKQLIEQNKDLLKRR